MFSKILSPIQNLKISLLSRGIRIEKEAEIRISVNGKVPLSIHEYATTGGVTLKLDNEIFINAPFGEWYCDPEAVLTLNKSTHEFEVMYRGETYSANVLPLPGYLEARDSKGNLIRDVVMSHADRARLSPISGCAFSCKFCNLAGQKYIRKPVDQVLEGYEVALADELLPARHGMLSGGTPSKRDYGYIDEVFEQVIRHSRRRVDVMMAPRDGDIIDRLVNWGVYGFAINIEVFDEETAHRIVPQKDRLGHELFTRSIERAVQLTGGNGRVRSLILVGLESEETTLAGVEFLARLGCDPVLSPFRPALGTPLERVLPPSSAILERTYLKSLEIVEKHGVKLGPRCIPCQHNTLTFPDGSPKYYYS